jgi:hypothetical protein
MKTGSRCSLSWNLAVYVIYNHVVQTHDPSVKNQQYLRLSDKDVSSISNVFLHFCNKNVRILSPAGIDAHGTESVALGAPLRLAETD